ncbi:MAG: DEAD/DEAH box helicase, partial [Bacteriovoracaceae bacterium]|nr:DEAD/DEAH box helicase [Bacteriovoracaceae bacterium]
MNEFEKLGIDEDFNPYYAELGIKRPNEVQSKVIPKMMKDQSLICLAQTGSGKTLSYALPISEKIKLLEDENGLQEAASRPYAVVIAPTKELATQIQGVFKGLSHHVWLRVRTMLGGTKGKSANLKDQSYEILVATPNRLAKALKNKEVSFRNLKWLVFDEADQLFDMGFKKDVEGMTKFVEFDDTTITFFSATLPIEVEEFIKAQFAKKELELVSFKEGHTIQQKVETYNIFLSPKEKLNMLKGFLEKTARGRGIVFANQKNQVEDIQKYIEQEFPKLRYRILHGDLTQQERAANHKAFVEKKAQVLIATDIAARGIDIKDLEWVLNFGLPKTAVYYLHRCGRVGRGGRKGVVYNFVTNFDAKLIGHINDAIKNQSQLDLEFI